MGVLVHTYIYICTYYMTVAQRLLNVEAKYTSLASQHELEGQNSVEDHLLACQRHWEEWARKQVKDEVQRIRDVELAQVKLAEREKYDKELATLREEVGKVHTYVCCVDACY